MLAVITKFSLAICKKQKELEREDKLGEFVHDFRLFCRNKAQALLEIL